MITREQKLEQALRDFVTEIRAYQSPECEECEIIGPLLRQADAVLSAPSKEAHPDNKAVDRFADAMKVKLAQKRKEGRGGWWDDAYCNNPELSAMLHEHVGKGDPLDVGNLAMMLHQRGERIAPAPKAEAVERRQFPVLGTQGQRIDFQLVSDHGEQALKNHYQSVERLAERGGLSWEELFAVLHDRPFAKIDTNDAIIACRTLEKRYLSATSPVPALTDEAVERVARAWASIDGNLVEFEDERKSGCSLIEEDTGTYEGYMSEAAELLRRSGLLAAFPRKGEAA